MNRVERPRVGALIALPNNLRSVDFTRLGSIELRRRVRELRTVGLPDRTIADLTGLGVIDVRRILGERAA
jgi:hypothetical protein